MARFGPRAILILGQLTHHRALVHSVLMLTVAIAQGRLRTGKQGGGRIGKSRRRSGNQKNCGTYCVVDSTAC
jgi:hypothetical protein